MVSNSKLFSLSWEFSRSGPWPEDLFADLRHHAIFFTDYFVVNCSFRLDLFFRVLIFLGLLSASLCLVLSTTYRIITDNRKCPKYIHFVQFSMIRTTGSTPLDPHHWASERPGSEWWYPWTEIRLPQGAHGQCSSSYLYLVKALRHQ